MYRFENHGSVWLVVPETPEAREALAAHVSPEAQWWGGSLVVEPRYVESLVASMEVDGLL